MKLVVGVIAMLLQSVSSLRRLQQVPQLRGLFPSPLRASSTLSPADTPSTPSSSTRSSPASIRYNSRTRLTAQSTQSPLMMSFEELSRFLGGTGRARTFWAHIRNGINPLDFEGEINETLSEKIKAKLRERLNNKPLISLTTVEETLSSCGTRKFLSALEDGLKIESVLIPSYKHDRTTLCVSTQVGCDRRCAFCATGKMGLTRNLTSLEIVSQVYHGLQIALREKLPGMTNVVFMGMGDAGRNIHNVGEAVKCLSDRDRFMMAASKCTVSTVGPSPEAFMELAQYPGTLAWSLHAADDAIRQFLVPSTRHTTVELRDGLIAALATRPSIKTRTIMIALTLIEGVNDSLGDAKKLADFVRPMLQVAPKIALDLIPYNDINTHGFKKPSTFAVNEFQALLRREGYFVSVRIARGDSESSACGMLSTKKKREQEAANKEDVSA